MKQLPKLEDKMGWNDVKSRFWGDINSNYFLMNVVEIIYLLVYVRDISWLNIFSFNINKIIFDGY